MREQKLKNKLKEIHAELYNRGALETTDIGVLSGSAGLALFHFYYNDYQPNEISEDLGSSILTSVVGSINEGYNFPTFCGGIAGAAWTIELLNELSYIELDTDALLSPLDDYLKLSLHIQTDDSFYDFLHGLLGVGYYFLKRYRNTSLTSLRDTYKGYLLEVLEVLNTTAQKSDEGIYWESYLIKEEGLKGCNLSLSHGLASIINFLARIAKEPDFLAVALPLLKGAVAHTMSYKKEVVERSFFPDWITEAHEESQSNRLAWCYGDLGVAISLWRASRVLDDHELKTAALQVLKYAAGRRDIEETRILDAGLCHGAFGVMHIFNYLHRETGIPLFKEAADYWVDVGLSMDTHEDGSAGYKKWRGGEIHTYERENSLLEGIAGIGLAILSYLHPEKMEWNQCLMIGD